MVRMRKWLLCALCTIVFVVTTATLAHAEDLPLGFLIGDHDGISVTRDGSYFIDAVGLRPGDVITKKLTIRNTEQGDLPYKLTMTAEPLTSTGPVDLLTNVDLEIKLDNVVIYSGVIRGDEGVDMVNNALALGTYSYGDSKVMDIRLTVHSDMELFNEKSEAFIKWNFYAVKDTTSDPPKTGEDNLRYILVAVLLVLNGVTLLLYKRTERSEGRIHYEKKTDQTH